MSLSREIVAEILARYVESDPTLPQPLAQLCSELFERLTRGVPPGNVARLSRGGQLEPWRFAELIRSASGQDPRCAELVEEIVEAQSELPPAPAPSPAVAAPLRPQEHLRSAPSVPAAGVQFGGSNFGNINTGPVSGGNFTFGGAGPAQAPGPEAKPAEPEVRILLLAANPDGTTHLRLDREMREVRNALASARYRDTFLLETAWAVRIGDLQRALLDSRPQILHFSGHGDRGVCIFDADDERPGVVTAGALARLFRALPTRLRCVVLNSCWSLSLAETIAEVVDVVVGMSIPIGDAAAIRFSVSFYRALASGCDVASAVELGRNEIELAGLGEEATPRLVAKRGDPRDLQFAGRGR